VQEATVSGIATDRFSYLACWPPAALLRHVLRELCAEAQIHTIELPPGLRIARRGNLHFAFNYDKSPLAVPADAEAEFVIWRAECASGRRRRVAQSPGRLNPRVGRSLRNWRP